MAPISNKKVSQICFLLSKIHGVTNASLVNRSLGNKNNKIINNSLPPIMTLAKTILFSTFLLPRI